MMEFRSQFSHRFLGATHQWYANAKKALNSALNRARHRLRSELGAP